MSQQYPEIVNVNPILIRAEKCRQYEKNKHSESIRSKGWSIKHKGVIAIKLCQWLDWYFSDHEYY